MRVSWFRRMPMGSIGVWVALAWLAITPLARAQGPQLRVVAIEGEGATNNVQAGAMADVVVEVQGEDQQPVAGASVSFVYPSDGPSGIFSDGTRTRIVATDASGRAVFSGATPTGETGSVPIRIATSYLGSTATLVVTQTNISVPVGPSSTIPRRGSMSRRAKILVVAGVIAAAAVGGILATTGGGDSSPTPNPGPPTGSPPIILTPGTPTVTGQ